MNDIYSKLFFRKQTDEEIEIDLCLSDTPQDSDADRTLDEAFYEPWDDVQIIEQISKIEFENFRNFKDHGEIRCSTDGKVTIVYGKNGDGTNPALLILDEYSASIVL